VCWFWGGVLVRQSTDDLLLAGCASAWATLMDPLSQRGCAA
jgi:hypothetical protein